MYDRRGGAGHSPRILAKLNRNANLCNKFLYVCKGLAANKRKTPCTCVQVNIHEAVKRRII